MKFNKLSNVQEMLSNLELCNYIVANNKYNSITKHNNIIVKKGPYSLLKGEIYFYENISKFLNISNFFVNFKQNINNNNDNNDKTQFLEFEMEYIHGIPLHFLHINKLITEKIIDDLFHILNKLHNENMFEITISKTNIHNNYFKKLKDRFNSNDYFFEDSVVVFNKIINDLSEHYSPQIAGIIHGDFWFSNIILDYANNYKLIDMKGQVDNILTLNGDIYYDYGKLYKSILGFGLCLDNSTMDSEYLSYLKKYYLEKCKEKKLNIQYLSAVTNSLIFGSFHAIEDVNCKKRVWAFLKKLIYSNTY